MDNKKKNGMRSRYDEDMDWLDDDVIILMMVDDRIIVVRG